MSEILGEMIPSKSGCGLIKLSRTPVFARATFRRSTRYSTGNKAHLRYPRRDAIRPFLFSELLWALPLSCRNAFRPSPDSRHKRDWHYANKSLIWLEKPINFFGTVFDFVIFKLAALCTYTPNYQSINKIGIINMFYNYYGFSYIITFMKNWLTYSIYYAYHSSCIDLYFVWKKKHSFHIKKYLNPHRRV